MALAKFKNLKFFWKLHILSTYNNLVWMTIIGRSEKNHQFGEPLFWLTLYVPGTTLAGTSVRYEFLYKTCFTTDLLVAVQLKLEILKWTVDIFRDPVKPSNYYFRTILLLFLIFLSFSSHIFLPPRNFRGRPLTENFRGDTWHAPSRFRGLWRDF